jgi:sulfate permease, SulP family
VQSEEVIAAYWLKLPVETVGSRFGGIPSGLPHLVIPHSLTLVCILLFAALLASYIPMAALAGILMIVAYNMGEWREIPQLLKLTKTDISVWIVTFALTVFADLTVAVEAGMILAALLFITRVANTTTVSQVTDDYVEDGRVHILQDKDIPYYATIFRIHGPFLFGATDKVSVVTENMHKLPPVVIIRLRNMTAIDATGIYALEEIAKQLHASGRTLILCGAREQPEKLMQQAEFEEVVGKQNICANVNEALRRAEEVFENIKPKAAAAK